MKRVKHRKGQVMVFEQVLLFAIGVAIFMILFAFFNIYQGYYTSIGVSDHISFVGDFLVSNILRLSSIEGDSSISIEIPETIGGNVYEMKLSDNGLTVSALGTSIETKKSWNIYNMGEAMTFSGKALSSGGRVVIYKKGNEIIIK